MKFIDVTNKIKIKKALLELKWGALPPLVPDPDFEGVYCLTFDIDGREGFLKMPANEAQLDLYRKEFQE